MAKTYDFGTSDPVAAEGADFGQDDPPAARKELPAGVQPSEAGAGRGTADDPRRLDRNRSARIAEMDDATAPFSDPATVLARTPAPAPSAPGMPGVLERRIDRTLPEPVVTPQQEARNVELSRRAAAEDRGGPALRGGTHKPNRATGWGEEVARNAAEGFSETGTRAIAKAGAGIAEGAWGGVRAAADVAHEMGVPGAATVADVAKESAGAAGDFTSGMGKPRPLTDFAPNSVANYLREQGEGAASSLATSALFASTFGARAVIPLLSVQSAGQQYQAARQAGLDPAAALANAIPHGAFEAIGEKFQGLDKAARAMGVLMTRGAPREAIKSAGEVLIRAGVREIPGEVLTFLGQTGVDALPGIGIRRDLTVEQFVDGLRDVVVQSAMMGGAMGAGGAAATMRADRPREKTAEQLARDKGFLRREEQVKQLKAAGEKEIAAGMQRQVDAERADAELEVLAERPWGADPAFQEHFRQLRGQGTKPAEAAARAGMATAFTQVGEGLSIDAGVAKRAIDAAANLPLEKIPTFLDRFVANLVKKGLAQPAPDGTVAGAVAGVRDDAVQTAVGALYPDQNAAVDKIASLVGAEAPPTDTVAAITQLEQQQPATPDASIAESSTMIPATTEAPTAAGAAEVEAAAPAHFGIDDLTPNEHGAHQGASSPRNEKTATKEQILGGNAPLGHMKVGGMGASIENVAGSTREDKQNTPPKWSTPMAHGFHYGYFKRTEAADSTATKRQGIDAFIAEGIPEDYDGPVHVVDQVNKDGSFDEHKAVVADLDEKGARAAYLAHYEPGWTGLGAITRFDTFTDFKRWARDGKKTDPVGKITTQEAAAAAPDEAAARGSEGAAADAGADPAGAPAGGQPVAVTAPRKALSVGRTPQTAEPVTVRNGTVYVGKYEALDYDTSEPVRIADGASDEQVRQALKTAGVLTAKDRFFGGEQDAAAPAPAPTSQPLVQEQKQAKAGKNHSPLRAFLREVGVSPKLMSDLTGERNGFRAHGKLPNTFRAGGLGLDLLAQRAHQRGFLTDTDMEDDIMAGRKLVDMIHAELRGERVQPQSDGSAEERYEAMLEQRRQNEEAAARDLALTPEELEETGFTDADAVLQARVRELVEQANAAGLDVDAILEDAAKKDENATQDEYLAAAAQDVEAALARARSEGAQDRGEDPGRAGAEAPGRGAAEGVAQERFEAGRALSKEQRKAVLKTLTDVYKSKGAPREQKGIGRDGNERYGYVHSPDLFEKSDITGAMVRYYVKLPDGRIAHPSELFPDYTQADIDKAMIEQAAAERDDAAQQRITEERAAKHAADTRADAESSFMKRNPGFDLRDWRTGKTRSFVHFEKGGKFFAVTDDDAKHMERLERAGWTRAEAPAQDLLGDAPNPNQQAAATARAEREEAERKKAAAAPDAAEFVLSGSDRPADEAAARGQGDLLASAPERIEDLGEKIGGARKDTAESNGTKRSRSNDDDRPAWARRFKVSQTVRAGGQLNAPRDEGRWVINDSRSLDFMGQPKQVGRQTFATKEEAEAFVPIAAVALKHRVGMSSEGKYEIWREVSDRKRVKVVEQKFDDREAAQEYMVRHAVEIIETNTTFGEGDLPLPPDKRREGPQRRTGNVVGQDFIDTFGFRGVEFGNWNNQDERQNLMNDAYDGLMDLADVMGIPPKAIGLNGDLALAFGARGHGLHSARAHYELERAVINLTKEHGTGSLAHEWFHALDYYFGRQDGKASGEWVRNDDGTRTFKKVATEDAVSHGFGFKSKVRPEVRAAYEKVLETIFKKASKYVEDTDKADKFTARAREDLAQELDALRRDLSTPQSWKTRNNKPASAEQLAEFDTIAQRLLSGEAQAVATDWRSVETAKNRIATRWTNDSIEQLGAIFKAVRGRVGFDSTNRNGPLDRLASATRRYSDRLKMLADAQAGAEKTRMSPTDFAMNAKELDQGRGTDYWTTPHEMAARAFQAFVDDKIAERGGVSRFLNYAPERAGILTPWGVKFPFPRAAERTAINNVLQTLIDAIETKVTNSGVAMYARGLSMRDAVERVRGIRAASVAEVQAIVDEHTAGWKSGPRVHVVPTAADLPIAAPDDTRGLHLNGEVYVVASAHRADAGLNQRVAVTLAHEAIAHYGLRKILGPAAFKRFLGDIQLAIASGNKPLTEIRAYVRRTYRNDDGSYTLTRGQESDEIAARAVEMAVDDEGNFRPGFSWLKSVWARVAQFLRDLGLKVPFTNTELHGMLVLSMRGLERGHRVDSGGTVLIRGDKPAFMFAGPRAGIQAGTMDTLPEARRMDASGAAMKDIRAETGWFRGPHDKKWRFEIPDEGARLVGWADVAESKLFGETHKFKLGAILDHPELFRAYPDARDIDVVKRAGFLDLGGLQGWFDGKNDMGVTPYAKEPLSTLLHEVQHWVQSREGFATGGNQNMVFDAMTQAQKERLGADVVPALEKRIVRAVDDAEAAKLAIQYRTFPELRELRDAKERFHELAKTRESGDPKRMVAFDAVNAATDRMHAKV
uniref:LPD23 domain-containing protein n=1 Tax=Ramlibacter sp. TaxID=1917967 RepID=UPI003D0C51C7